LHEARFAYRLAHLAQISCLLAEEFVGPIQDLADSLLICCTHDWFRLACCPRGADLLGGWWDAMFKFGETIARSLKVLFCYCPEMLGFGALALGLGQAPFQSLLRTNGSFQPLARVAQALAGFLKLCGQVRFRTHVRLKRVAFRGEAADLAGQHLQNVVQMPDQAGEGSHGLCRVSDDSF
jgi:hypothetical protein